MSKKLSNSKTQPRTRLRTPNPIFFSQNQQTDAKELSHHLIRQARKSGQLNLSGRGLATVPEKVWHLDEPDEVERKFLVVKLDEDTDGEKWWEQEPLSTLDLSSNRLKVISPKLKNLALLTVLNLQDNSLEKLPVEIGDLNRLTKLNVSHNQLKEFPETLYNLNELRSLIASHNQLEQLSEGLGDLIMLEILDLSHNSLTLLPFGVGFLTRLTKLDLSHNRVQDIAPDLGSLRALVELDITYNKLISLPPLGELRKLERLYLQHNRLSELPDLRGCTSLKELHLGDNIIKELDPEILECLSSLKVFDLKDNKLDEIPEEISHLQGLMRLDLINNTLTELPNSLGLLPHLQSVQLEGNPMRKIRKDIVQCGTQRILRHLRGRMEATDNDAHLSLSRGEQNVPDNFAYPDRFIMRSGRALNLAMKSLSEVPKNVFEEAFTAEVGSVDLSKNNLPSVPTGLHLLSSLLTELNLSCNRLTSVPEFLGECQQLQFLDLQKNFLDHLPDQLASLAHMRELIISYNRLSQMPACIYEMEGLEILIARDNQMTVIEVENLSKLKRIAVLDLSNNNIGHIPPELGNLRQLRSLEIAGNIFRQPRHAILEKGTASLLSYLRDRIPQ